MEALDSLAGYLEDYAGASVAVNLDLVPAFLPERYFVNLLHILQETFSNIEQYSHSKEVLVSLATCDRDFCLTSHRRRRQLRP